MGKRGCWVLANSAASFEILDFLGRCVDEFGQSIVMVTHEPSAAAYADRVLFLADGRIVDEMVDPTAEKVLERMKGFDGRARRSAGSSTPLPVTEATVGTLDAGRRTV